MVYFWKINRMDNPLLAWEFYWILQYSFIYKIMIKVWTRELFSRCSRYAVFKLHVYFICRSSLVNTLDTGPKPAEALITTLDYLYRIGKGQTDVHLRELSLLIGFVDQAW